jgi:hypothetical protein
MSELRIAPDLALAEDASQKTPPTVRVVEGDEVADIRAWARTYVNLICTIEGIALVPSALKKAS